MSAALKDSGVELLALLAALTRAAAEEALWAGESARGVLGLDSEFRTTLAAAAYGELRDTLQSLSTSVLDMRRLTARLQRARERLLP